MDASILKHPVSPTIFRKRGFRAYFFSRDEARVHVHLRYESGVAKFWLEPRIELAHATRLSKARIAIANQLVREHQDEIRAAWKAFFQP